MAIYSGIVIGPFFPVNADAVGTPPEGVPTAPGKFHPEKAKLHSTLYFISN